MCVFEFARPLPGEHGAGQKNQLTIDAGTRDTDSGVEERRWEMEGREAFPPFDILDSRGKTSSRGKGWGNRSASRTN